MVLNFIYMAKKQKVLDQNEALLLYRRTGIVGTYIDPTRDQEPLDSIGAALGEAPHPELGNPVPPDSSFTGKRFK